MTQKLMTIDVNYDGVGKSIQVWLTPQTEASINAQIMEFMADERRITEQFVALMGLKCLAEKFDFILKMMIEDGVVDKGLTPREIKHIYNKHLAEYEARMKQIYETPDT